MTLAGTTGYMVPQKFGFRFGISGESRDGAPNYFAHGGRVFMEPKEYRSKQSINGYNFNTYWWIMIDTATYTQSIGIEDRVNLGEAKFSVFDNGTVSNFNWVEDDSSGQHISTKKVKSWGDSEIKPRYQYGLVRCSSEADNATEQEARNLYAMYIEANNDNEPTTDDVVLSGVHPDTSTTAFDWSPFDENESCSAWVMMQTVCRNQNRIIAETKPAWSTPLYDQHSDASGGTIG